MSIKLTEKKSEIIIMIILTSREMMLDYENKQALV